MTTNLDPAINALIAELEAISDPALRFQATVTAEARLDDELRKVRQRIAVELYDGGARPYREVGSIMGGVTAQRAEQIAKGR
ncbi:hypothetical protein [Streptomyces venezuelae]|uniref:Uncharacterized protein n=1 Tax=Streptomyces venezuelae TaxID=54571 RepID=A0A5P2B7U4_STRVZ|nr:hypothetical protein [Streptomyces venezuelae]QES25858.1 hypothetical protein DEJ47_04770 [Streptomyces venezuelae]